MSVFIKQWWISLVLVGTVLFFQNCSETQFSPATDIQKVQATDNFEIEKNETDSSDGTDPDYTEPTQPNTGGETPPTTGGQNPPNTNGTKPPKNNEEGSSHTNENQAKDRCIVGSIAELVVNVSHTEISGGNNRIMLTQHNGTLDLLDLRTGINLTSPQDVKVHQIRFVLANEGNYIVDSEGNRFNIKVPSGQSSGLKLSLPGGVLLKAGEAKTFKAALDPASQVHQAGSKCILKPLLKITAVDHHLVIE